MELSLVGHPFSPIGRGEDIRKTYQALSAVGMRPKSVVDIYKLNDSYENLYSVSSIKESVLNRGLQKINVFHINGDEVKLSLAHLQFEGLDEGYNIVYPAWELPNYPDDWALQLDRFDEIWAPTNFIKRSLEKSCKKKIVHMPLACDVRIGAFYPRKFFDIPENKYTFLFFFDLRSFSGRKNPFGLLQAFEKLLHEIKSEQIHLVLKIHGGDDGNLLNSFELFKSKYGSNLTVIDAVLSEDQIRSLVVCCDCFVSLHRAEGFGRGIAEAMLLGKPVIATAWSGNMDFMNAENCFGVDYKLVPVEKDAYPAWEGQSWAEPDIEHASKLMQSLVKNPSNGYLIGNQARIDLNVKLGLMSSGVRYSNRINEIIENLSL
jgi:glycosyltransferase involved in cell wall biosynthesis